MRSMFTLFLLGTFALPVIAADDPALEGKWVVVSLTRDGKEDASMKGALRVNKGADYNITPKEGKAVPGTFKIDSSKTPKTMDMMPTEGRYKGKTLLGIYKVEGNKLTICFAEPGKDRPTEFASKPGSGTVLAVHEKAR